MPKRGESIELKVKSVSRGQTLHRAVRRAMRTRDTWARVGIIAAGLSAIPNAMAAPFPPVFPLATLLPEQGGDGSKGFVLTGADAGDDSGWSVSAAGDVNGDGIDDVIIGARTADPGGRDRAGETYVVFGSKNGFPAELPLANLHPGGGGDGSVGFVLTGVDVLSLSGGSVSGAGDINGDGVDDLIIGADLASPRGRSNAGASYVVFGSIERFPAELPLATLLPPGGGDGSVGFVLTGVDAGDNSGHSVSVAGDVNGDGIDDLIIGAYHADHGGRSNAGATYVVFGSTQPFPAVLPLVSLLPAAGGDGTAGFVLTGIKPDDLSGVSVSAAGDMNGDGIDDVIVGARYADANGRDRAGAFYVIFGSTRGFRSLVPLASLLVGDGSAGFVLTGIDPEDYIGESGMSVSAAGDVNRDGIDDIIIGAFQGDPGGRDAAGESYVVFGTTHGFPAVLPLASLFAGDGSAGFVLTGVDVEDFSGISVSGAGDVNGDGGDDVIVGAFRADPGGAYSAGESYVLFGSTQSFPAVLPLRNLLPSGGGDGSTGFVLAGADDRGFSGYSVSEAGDVNGDGVDDVIIGAHRADPGGRLDAGVTYVVFGRATDR